MEFNKAYNRQEFINFLQHNFLPEDFVPTVEQVSFATQMKYSSEATKLGSSQTLDLVVYEIKHTSSHDARVVLSKEAFRMLADEMEDRALVVFVPEDNNDNYRFSFIEITLDIIKGSSRITRNYSNPRRYSYLLGKGIAYYTPNKYLNEKGRVVNDEDLHSRFSVEVLTKEFYKELSDWYYWAIQIIRFPNDIDDDKDDAKYNSEGAIRLITRLIFVWFLKQRHLIPDEFFDEKYIADHLIEEFDPHKTEGLFNQKSYESKYYKAILQNLFFAMLNSPITTEGGNELSERHFRNGRGDYDNNKLMRYESYFKNPQLFVDIANRTVPFLNGGLFDCLDEKDKGMYYDGFSDRDTVKNSLVVPDFLFFGEEAGKNIDLSEWYGDKNKKTVSAHGIIDILKRYNFTVEENTPFDKEVSLDPELLGKVFENLLASFNPETQTTARKQTGSFYTPREIVQYMVDESLVAHLKRTVGEELEPQFRQLLQYTDEEVIFTEEQRKLIMQSLYDCKILDPACGSGAFPMGILQQMVHILGRIDPDNEQWKEMMMTQAISETSDAYRNASDDERKEIIADIESNFNENVNRPDYARKLYLIENCIYGVDIQPIAIQISKLRFFISLVVDQKTNADPTDNFGIRPLPNLEAKFVAANTLIGLNKKEPELFDSNAIKAKENDLKSAKHKIFSAKTVRTKRKWRDRVNELRQEIADMLKECGAVGNVEAQQLSGWDMFDQNASSPFFDPEWMFGVKDGFDIVIGNPPYLIVYDKIQKQVFESSFIEFRQNNDLYTAFFSVTIQMAIKEGVISLITPNTYLKGDYFKELRNTLSINRIHSIVDFNNSLIFESATVFSAVIVLSKSKPLDKWILKSNLETVKGFVESNSKEFVMQNSIAKKLENLDTIDRFFLVKDVGYNYWSIGRGKVRGNSIGSRILYKGNKQNIGDIPYVKGANFERYTTPVPENFLRYNYADFLNENDVFRFSAEILHTVPKIIYRQTSNRIIASVDINGFHTDKTVHCIINRPLYNYDLYALVGILNSKLLDYLYSSNTEENGRAFAQVKTVNIKKLPFIYDKEIFNAISIYVKEIFDNKNETIEKNIDLLVYKLYNLTYDEVLIVDPETSITKKEYES